MINNNQLPPEGSIEVPEPIQVDRMLSTNQVAAILSISAETLRKWRQRRRCLRFYTYRGGVVRYRLSDVLKFIDNSGIEPNKPAA